MRIGSLCTGYGGIDLALGGQLAWVADNAPGPSKLLAHRMPAVPNLGDLTRVEWSHVEPVDIITGGFPCQPFSHAGKREGTNDERHIWPHIARALGVLRPRYAFFENVPGLLSLGFADVLADLAQIGFDARWVCVRAADVGAPHRRERVFIVATNTEVIRRAERWPEPTPRQWGYGAAIGGAALSADTERAGSQGQPISQLLGPSLIAARDRAATPNTDGQRFGQLGGTKPATARQSGAQHGGTATNAQINEQREQADRGIRAEPRHGAERSDTQWGAYAPAITRWEHLTGRIAPNATEPNSRGKQRLSPRFVEWLMGLPGGWVTDVPGLSRTKQLELLGNGVVPQQARAAFDILTDAKAAA